MNPVRDIAGFSLEKFLDALPLPMAVIAPDHTVIFMNRAARSGGRDGEKCFELLAGLDHPCAEQGIACPVLDAIDRNRVVESVRELDLGAGCRVFEILACPLTGRSGKPEAVIEIIRDVTDSMLLRQSRYYREQMRIIEEVIPDAIITINSEGRVVTANQAVGELFGVSPDDLRRDGVEILLPPEIRAKHKGYVARAVARGALKPGMVRVEVNAVHRDRGEVPVELSLASWFRGEEIMFTGVARDIADRKAIEADRQREHEDLAVEFRSLEKIKREWQMLIDSVPDPLLMADISDRIVRCNRAFFELVSLPYPEIIGQQWKDFVLAHNIYEGDFWGDNLTMVHSRSSRVFAVRVSGLRGDGHHGGSVVVLQDVTAEITMTRELEEKRAALHAALEGIGDTIVRVARESDFSQRVQTEIRGNCWEVMACGKKDCPSYGESGGRCWEKVGTFFGGEVQGEFAKKIGNCRDCRFYLRQYEDPLTAIGEQFNHMMAILENKNQELQGAYGQLQQAQSQLLQQEKMASIGQLAAGVAHEINNPVGFIASNLGSMARYGDRLRQYIAGIEEKYGADPEIAALRKKLKIGFILDDLDDLVRESQEGTDRVRDIVMNLKVFSRIDQSANKLADINECIESTLKIVWNELKYKARVDKDLGEIPLTLCQAQQLNQVFMNLLVNAGQAIADKGVIKIRSWREDDWICVAISDTGSGIAKEALPRIFEPFYTTKEVGKGTGLGLSIVYDIVTNKHKGSIEVDSEEGRGTTFVVKIPVIEEDTA